MLESGEVDALVPERVWQELERVLGEKHPENFFAVLKNCGALSNLFPQIAKHLSPIKKGLKNAAVLSSDSLVRFAAIAFNLDKPEITTLCKKYRLPNTYKELSLLVFKIKDEENKIS